MGCGAPMLSCDGAKSSNDQPPSEGKVISPLDGSAITEDNVATEVFDEKSMVRYYRSLFRSDDVVIVFRFNVTSARAGFTRRAKE